VDLILPGFDAIADRLDDVVGLVLTHGHEDHIGAVPYLLRNRVSIPLIGSKLTLALLNEKLASTASAIPISGWSSPATRSGSASSSASSSRSTTRSRTHWRWPCVRRPA
jgi:glyoxylase-like metal-dependent hydrolase (beta-lactamase superfamily II)